MALLVKMCTTAALVSSLMNLICQMSFQVVKCLIKGISEFFILGLRYHRFLVDCSYSVLSLGTKSFWNLTFVQPGLKHTRPELPPAVPILVPGSPCALGKTHGWHSLGKEGHI